MKTPHKHAALIKAWADGAEIEVMANGTWEKDKFPMWNTNNYYRIKLEPKPDAVDLYYVEHRGEGTWFRKDLLANLKLTYDGETGKLKSAEVI